MARYPVHRHRLPLRELARSARWAWLRLEAVMIMPGEQNPHWKPWAWRNARCIGCSAPSRREAFDGRDLAAFGTERRDEAAVHGLAVEQHAAGAAVAGVAAFLDAEPSELPQEGAQALARARRRGGTSAVDEIGHGVVRELAADFLGEMERHVPPPDRGAVHVVVILGLGDGLARCVAATPRPTAARGRRAAPGAASMP